MSATCRIRMARAEYDAIHCHLFPGDGDEHGAVVLAGVSSTGDQRTLHVREIHIAREEDDYSAGQTGYKALKPSFIHKCITRARDERLVYLAAHNHASDQSVSFSRIDLDSHELGYPALLQIAKGMPVGGLVFGKRALELDLWLPSGKRESLDEAVIVGTRIDRLTPVPRRQAKQPDQLHDRQIRMFGAAGQRLLARCRVAIIGLGGIGSLVSEYLARLGVGRFCLIDGDRIEASNLSRVVGATRADVDDGATKVEIARRTIWQANPQADIDVLVDDVARPSVAAALTTCDFLFLAADSMRARLVVNAVVHQYLIPGVQLGAKIQAGPHGSLTEAMSVNRPLRPGRGCLLCNQLIDPTQLALEAKSDDERKAQAYGVEDPNPSVITLNAIAAAHAVNDFVFDYLSVRPEAKQMHYEHYHFLKRSRSLVEPRRDVDCTECSVQGLRYARGDAIALPCLEG